MDDPKVDLAQLQLAEPPPDLSSMSRLKELVIDTHQYALWGDRLSLPAGCKLNVQEIFAPADRSVPDLPLPQLRTRNDRARFVSKRAAPESQPHFVAACAATNALLGADENPNAEAGHADYRYQRHDPAELAALVQHLLGAAISPDELGRNHLEPADLPKHGGLPAGLSELDDVPSAALAAKPAYGELAAGKHAGSSHGESRLSHFQGHELSQTAVDLGANLGLGAALGAGGLAAIYSGITDIHQAGKDKKQLLNKTNKLIEKRAAFLASLQSDQASRPAPDAGNAAGRGFKSLLLERELLAVDAEIERLESKLHLNGQHRDVGAGSATAGLLSLVRAIIDLSVKPVAYFRPETIEVTGTVLSSVAVGLAPLAAIAGLGMGIKAKMLSHAQRKEFKQKLQLAMEELGVLEDTLPADMAAHYRRCFVEGKWHSRDEQTKSFNKLLTYFVSGMSGYTATVSGLSIAKIVALLAVGAIAADVTLSSTILASALVVLLGVYGFLKYHSKEHRYAQWADSPDPGFDREFMLSLAASGHIDGLIQALKLSRLVEEKRIRRDDFLHLLAVQSGLRPPAAKVHSTDSAEVRQRRKEQKAGMGENATQRFLASHKMTGKNMKAMAGAAGRFASAALLRGAGQASAEARQTYASRSDVLSKKSLAFILAAPKSSAALVDYMLADLEDDLRYLDDEIHQKIKFYGPHPLHSKTPVDAVAADAVNPDPGGSPEDKNKTGKKLFRFRKAQQSAAPVPGPLSPTGIVDEHFSGIGHVLRKDQHRLEDMQVLRAQLQQWKKMPVKDAARMASMQARFLAIQQRRLYNASGDSSGDIETSAKNLADELVSKGKERNRETLGRLHVFTLDTTPLRRAAAAAFDARGPAWDAYAPESA